MLVNLSNGQATTSNIKYLDFLTQFFLLKLEIDLKDGNPLVHAPATLTVTVGFMRITEFHTRIKRNSS